MLTLGIISGVLLFKNIEGIYFNWNIKQVYSLVLWLFYAVILYLRLFYKMHGKRVAVLSILVFL